MSFTADPTTSCAAWDYYAPRHDAHGAHARLERADTVICVSLNTQQGLAHMCDCTSTDAGALAALRCHLLSAARA